MTVLHPSKLMHEYNPLSIKTNFKTQIVQRIRANLHQLYQWALATIFQPSHVCVGTRGIQTWRYQLGFHWFRNGSVGLHWDDWKGSHNIDIKLMKLKATMEWFGFFVICSSWERDPEFPQLISLRVDFFLYRYLSIYLPSNYLVHIYLLSAGVTP